MKKILVALIFISMLSCNKDDDNQNSGMFERLSINTTESITDISFIDENQGIVCGSLGFMAKTNDGGKTWSQLNVGVNHSFSSAFMLNEQSFYTARIGIYKTNNSGNSFNELSNLSNFSNSVFGIHFFNENSGIIIKGSLILKTNDGGDNWSTKYSNAEYISELQMTSNLNGYVAGGITYDGKTRGEFHKTIDGGETWTQTLNSSSDITSISFISDKIGYYVNINNELYKTINGSNNWIKISNLPNTPLNICFVNENIGYSSTYQGQILMTENGGKNWKIVYNKTNYPIVKIIRKNNVIYAIGNNGLILKKK